MTEMRQYLHDVDNTNLRKTLGNVHVYFFIGVKASEELLCNTGFLGQLGSDTYI